MRVGWGEKRGLSAASIWIRPSRERERFGEWGREICILNGVKVHSLILIFELFRFSHDRLNLFLIRFSLVEFRRRRFELRDWMILVSFIDFSLRETDANTIQIYRVTLAARSHKI